MWAAGCLALAVCGHDDDGGCDYGFFILEKVVGAVVVAITVMAVMALVMTVKAIVVMMNNCVPW